MDPYLTKRYRNNTFGYDLYSKHYIQQVEAFRPLFDIEIMNQQFQLLFDLWIFEEK
ncbi:hypothetical protein [Acetivibrio cellulolyticus]